METTNNNPETKATPPLEDRMRIFMQYPGQIVHPVQNDEFIPFPMATISLNGWVWYDVDEYQLDAETCCIAVKPLGRISEEHKLELERLCCMKNSRQTLQMILFDLHNRTSIVGPNVHWVQIITDQCREWGYALPYKNWSVKELVEFGIYKLIE